MAGEPGLWSFISLLPPAPAGSAAGSAPALDLDAYGEYLEDVKKS